MSVRFLPALEPLLVPIDSVRQHPDNPRNGDLDRIVESMSVNGCYAPILVQRSTGYILLGNHRWQALHALGSDKAPVLFTDVTDPVAALRIMVADNATTDHAQYDPGLHAAALSALYASEEGLLGAAVTQEEAMAILTPPPPDVGYALPPSMAGIWQVVLTCESEADALEAQTVLADRGFEAKVLPL